MSRKRKPNRGDPRNHPGNDMITVVYPKLPPVPQGWEGDELDDASPEMVAATATSSAPSIPARFARTTEGRHT
jgi:hypothetical protein